MRLILILVCFMTILFSQSISEKLIISADTNMSTAQMHLLKLKMFFIENQETRTLQEESNLTLTMETLDDYEMVVIKPIRSLAVKNELLFLLSPYFPDIFSIHENKIVMAPRYKEDSEMLASQVFNGHSTSKTDKNSYTIENIIHKIGLQWVALLLLSIIGLAFSINSRRKMASLERMQQDLSQKQEEIEKEIKHLGATNV